jgi:cytidylate kinase
MSSKKRSIEQIIGEQVQKWQISKMEKLVETVVRPVITVSREPGSGGRVLAQKLADKHQMDLFHQELLHEMAASAKVSRTFLHTLDEKGLSVLEDWIASLVHQRHLWPDQYQQHLMKVVGTIGKHGNAVVVGRGANFILPPEGRLRVRVISPLEVRIENLVKQYGVSAADAKRRIIRTENERRAFIRKYFNADIANPTHYDLVINTGTLQLDHAVDTITSAAGL